MLQEIVGKNSACRVPRRIAATRDKQHAVLAAESRSLQRFPEMAKKTSLDKAPQNEDSSKNNEDSSNEDEEPNFSDPEDFVDDITDEGTSVDPP